MAKASMESDRADLPLEVNTTVKDTGTWAKTVDVIVPAAKVSEEFNFVAGEIAAMVALPGFRKGKIPRDIIEKRFGDEIKKQVTSNLLTRAMRSALTNERLDVVGEPLIESEHVQPVKGEPLAFDIKVEVKPTFELGQYKGLSIEQEEIEVLPGEIEQAIDGIRERYAEPKDAPADHAMGNRDVAAGPLRFLVDGVEVHTEDARLLVVDGHVLGAYTHLGAKYLEGAKVGEKRTVEEVIGDQFPAEAQRGKKATIEFEIKSIQTYFLPAADDALAEKLGLKTFDELKTKVRESLLERLSSEISKRTRDALLEKAVLATKFELPARLIDTIAGHEIKRRLAEFKGTRVDPELSKRLEGASREAAVNTMHTLFVADAISNKEGLSVTDEDVDQEIVKIARAEKMRASEVYDRMRDKDELRELEQSLKISKVVEFLVEQAEIKIVPRAAPSTPATAGHEHHEHAPHGEHGHEHGAKPEHGHEHGAQTEHEHAGETPAPHEHAGETPAPHEHGSEHGHEHG